MKTEYKVNEKLTALHGYDSAENAYVVNDYPYGFRLRCKIRYWIETTKNGQRFCSQTTNPKKAGEVWNKPKKSTYFDLACLLRNETNGHISYAPLTWKWSPESFVENVEKYGFDKEDSLVKDAIRSSKILAVANSKISFTIVRTTGETEEEREKREQEQQALKRKVLAYAVHTVDSQE